MDSRSSPSWRSPAPSPRVVWGALGAPPATVVRAGRARDRRRRRRRRAGPLGVPQGRCTRPCLYGVAGRAPPPVSCSADGDAERAVRCSSSSRSALSLRVRPRLRPRGPPGRGPRAASSGGPRRCSSQEELAPQRWAARLAPEDLPDVRRASRSAGSTRPAPGSWPATSTTCSGVAPTRLAAVIGDVTGHGIEPSITAFQAKYLLRVFLRQYRDPAQALEELNTQMSAPGRTEEFISPVRRRVRHRGRHAALRLGRATRRPGCGTTARCARCGPPGRC